MNSAPGRLQCLYPDRTRSRSREPALSVLQAGCGQARIPRRPQLQYKFVMAKSAAEHDVLGRSARLRRYRIAQLVIVLTALGWMLFEVLAAT